MDELIALEQAILEFLANFTPLIQLWAGICLLFFYLNILERSPLYSYIGRINERYNNIINVLQGYSQNNTRIPTNYIYDNWDEFRPRVINIAALTFFYCVFLIFIISIGKYNQYRMYTPHIYIFSTSIFFIFYILCCSLINKRIFKSNTTPVIYAFIIIPLLYAFCFRWLESIIFRIDFLNNDKNYIIIGGLLVLLTCLLGLFAVLCYIATIWWNINKPRTKKLVALSEDLDLLYNALFSINPLSVLSHTHNNGIMEKFHERLSNASGNSIINIIWDTIIIDAPQEFNEIMNG